MLSPPRSPASTIWLFPPAECCFRAALRISFATFSAAAFCATGSRAHLQSLAVALSQTLSVAQARAEGNRQDAAPAVCLTSPPTTAKRLYRFAWRRPIARAVTPTACWPYAKRCRPRRAH
jgi:hypothetical protein